MPDISAHFVYPYIRASTDRQEISPHVQWDRIKNWYSFQDFGPEYALHDPFIDAATSSRVAFENRTYGSILLSRIRPKDVMVVYKLERAFRNTREALNVNQILADRGARLMGVLQNLDTSTSGGRFYFTVLAGAAQMERENISERTKDALDWRKERGFAASGRPPVGWMMKKTKVSGVKCSLLIPNPATRFPGLLAVYLKEQIGLNTYQASFCLSHLDLINAPHANGVTQIYNHAKSGFTLNKREPCQQRHPEVDDELNAEIVRIFGRRTKEDWLYLIEHRTFPDMPSAEVRKLKLLSPSIRKAS